MVLRTQKLRSSQRLGARNSFKYICDNLSELILGLEPMIKKSDMRFKQAQALLRDMRDVIDFMGCSNEEALQASLNLLISRTHETAAVFRLTKPINHHVKGEEYQL
ncbi:hypothetical protein LCGC14_0357390 [marine sediment metagenome]|uniref:Uncharacterized protein n=1 Tax=marine sediment metagenome TaxID=412755 RepID=A0A0F9T9A4_9ZZZZ